MKISDLISTDSIILNLNADSKQKVLEEIAVIAAEKTNSNYEKLLETLLERENICSTAIDEGVAIPHGKLPGLSKIFCLIARSEKGIDFDSLDGKPTRIFILLLSPEDSPGIHIDALSSISKVIKTPQVRENILNAPTADIIFDLITGDNGKTS